MVNTVVDPSVLERLRRIRAMKSSNFPAEAATAGRMLDEQLQKLGLTEADLDGTPKRASWESLTDDFEEALRRTQGAPSGRRPDKVYQDETLSGFRTWGQLPSFHYGCRGTLTEAYIHLFFVKRKFKFEDSDMTFDETYLAETLARDCRSSRNSFLTQMYTSVSSYESLTRAQARATLNIVLGNVRGIRDSLVRPTEKECLVCKAHLPTDRESQRRCLDFECYKKVLGLE